MMRTHLVVMGVAGCGKSTVAAGLHELLAWPLAEGDDFHSIDNITKMSEGVPLTDEDRWPWLDSIVAWTGREDAAGYSTIVTCSALRRVYRDRLRSAPGRTLFVHLTGTERLLAERMNARPGHFMPPSLLPSQLATLEPLEDDEAGVVLDIAADVPELVRQAAAALDLVP
jgi:carbohydrate kinase (thermoresistant glucokinase family)